MNRPFFEMGRVTSYDAEIRAHERRRRASRLFFAALVVCNLVLGFQLIKARRLLREAQADAREAFLFCGAAK